VTYALSDGIKNHRPWMTLKFSAVAGTV